MENIWLALTQLNIEELLKESISNNSLLFYLIVFLMLVLATLGTPVPDELTLLTASFLAGLGYANPYILGIIAFLAITGINSLLFWFGRTYGPAMLRFKYVKKLFPIKRIVRYHRALSSYAGYLVLFCHYAPVIRMPFNIFIGASKRFPYYKFLLIDIFATAIQMPLIIYIGYTFANNRELIAQYSKNAQAVGITLILLIVISGISYHIIKKLYNNYLRKYSNALK